MDLLSSTPRKKATEISSAGHHGLRILILKLSEIEEFYSNNNNNIVVKSGLKSLTQTTSIITSSISNISTNNSSIINSAKTISSVDGRFNCFLKSCCLCKKSLSPDKDVYMYRGDQGFCSVECRSKQIMVDETKEMDAITKNRLRASTISIDCQGCETCKLLEDLRQRRNRRNNKFKPLITPTNKHQQPLLSFS